MYKISEAQKERSRLASERIKQQRDKEAEARRAQETSAENAEKSILQDTQMRQKVDQFHQDMIGVFSDQLRKAGDVKEAIMLLHKVTESALSALQGQTVADVVNKSPNLAQALLNMQGGVDSLVHAIADNKNLEVSRGGEEGKKMTDNFLAAWSLLSDATGTNIPAELSMRTEGDVNMANELLIEDLARNLGLSYKQAKIMAADTLRAQEQQRRQKSENQEQRRRRYQAEQSGKERSKEKEKEGVRSRKRVKTSSQGAGAGAGARDTPILVDDLEEQQQKN